MLYQTIALDQKGTQVSAIEAVRGEIFNCPSCNGVMILRRGKKNIAHFAHKNLVPNCKPETVLHFLGKECIRKIIEGHISNSESMEVKFRCTNCKGDHVMNMLESVTEVRVEKSLSSARPDISLRTQNRKTVVVEVVVSHEPEDKVLSFLDKNKIFYVRVKLKSYSDLERVEEIMLEQVWDPAGVYKGRSFCTYKKPKDKKMKQPSVRHNVPIVHNGIFVLTCTCMECRRETKLAASNLDLNSIDSIGLPDSFSKDEIEFATRNGVVIGEVENGRLTNICKWCKKEPLKSNIIPNERGTKMQYLAVYEDYVRSHEVGSS